MDYLDLPALHRAAGIVRLPGSKSISNRTLLLAALAEGRTEIHDLLDSDDTQVMLAGLQKLGVRIDALGANSYAVHGVGGAFPVKQAELFLGNAGTAFRPLTAALALSSGEYTLSGVARMHERPIGDLVDGLRQIGVQVDYLQNDGYPPLKLSPSVISLTAPIKVRGDVSSQFLTALLMALPLAGKTAQIEVVGELISKPYIEITLNLMARFGIKVERSAWSHFTIHAGKYVSPGSIHVEGDASSASYFLAAGAIGGGPVRVEGVGSASIQGDVKFADALAAMGAQITYGDNWIECRSPLSPAPSPTRGEGGKVRAKLRAFDMDFNHIPDAAMTLAAAALFADGPCTLRNIASWRVKETDRIAAMATELRKVGAEVEEGADYLRVAPPVRFIPNAAIDTYDDHRMAMCLSLAALGGVPVRINDPKCVGKTFPEYFDAFARIAAPVIAIDGPSASGKGTVAARVAAQLGYHYLDSGALYRLTALAAKQKGIDWDDEPAVAVVAASLPAVFEGEKIFLDGQDVTEAIRTEEIGIGASKVAALPMVRTALLACQRAYQRFPGLVGDGRDMGSVIFPWAETKVFLTATAEARAERRYKQLIAKGMSANIAVLLQDLQARDARDSARSVGPLKHYEDAALVDTTSLTIEQAVQAVLDLAAAKAS